MLTIAKKMLYLALVMMYLVWIFTPATQRANAQETEAPFVAVMDVEESQTETPPVNPTREAPQDINVDDPSDVEAVDMFDAEQELAKLVSDAVQQSNGQLLGSIVALGIVFMVFFSSVVALGLFLLWRSMPTQGVKDLLVSATEQFKTVVTENTARLRTPFEIDDFLGNIFLAGIDKFWERIGYTPAPKPPTTPPPDTAPPPDVVPLGG